MKCPHAKNKKISISHLTCSFRPSIPKSNSHLFHFRKPSTGRIKPTQYKNSSIFFILLRITLNYKIMSNNKQDFSHKSIRSNSSEAEDEGMDNFKKILKNNKEWANSCVENEPDYFLKLVNVQKPKYLWIGCSDSRVPANEIMGLKPGQVFVHRNVANIASPADINFLAVVQYAVEHLGVQDIIVSGHYKCGGIKAAFKQNDFGPLQSWLSHIRELRSKFRQSLLGNQEQKQHTLVELNVKQQVINVSRVAAVQQAWTRGHNLHIHGVVYNLQDGILKDLGLTTSRIEHVPEEYRLAKKQKQPKVIAQNKNKARKISKFEELKQNHLQSKSGGKDQCKQIPEIAQKQTYSPSETKRQHFKQISNSHE